MTYENTLVLKINKLDTKLSIAEYKSLLKLDWNRNIFYSYEYLKYYEKEDQQLRCFILEEEGEPIILMPFFIRTIPFDLNQTTQYYDVITPYGYGGPLYDIKYIDLLDAFWNKVDQWYQDNNIITEFVRFSLTDNCKYYTGKLTHSLSNIKGKILYDQEEQWKKFSPKVRNNYRKALKNNLSFNSFKGKNIEAKDIQDFHEIYIETMKRNNALESYFFTIEYFNNLIFENKEYFEIVFVEKDGIRISTELLIHSKDTIYAFLGGTKQEFFDCRPNDFLRVEVIKHACKNKINYYVLGGGRQDGDGLFKSKKALFPKDENCSFYTGRKILNNEIYEELLSKQKHAELANSNPSFFPKYRIPA